MRAPRRCQHARHARRRVVIGMLLAVALWGLTAGRVSAHAHLVQADPAPDSVIAHAPGVASFLFDEPLNPALTRVRITAAAGRLATTNTGRLAPGHNGALWELPLPPLPSGAYSVFWVSESAIDGHIMSSFYTFSVAPSGGIDSVGAVTGVASGSYGGTSVSGSRGLLTIGGGTVAVAGPYWLELMAEALWLGALVIDLAVLAPARRTGMTPEARLAAASTPRLCWLVRGALIAAALALALEVLSLAAQGTGGDWGRALAPTTLGGILSSQNGHFMLLRAATLVMALLLAARPLSRRETARFTTGWTRHLPSQTAAVSDERSPRALGLTAPTTLRLTWEDVRGPLALLAAIYMLFVALSGHAGDITPGWLAYPIDWAHLLFTGAWVGGIAVLAMGVLPLRHVLAPEERAPAVLSVLARFSPVAFAAVGVLALSGLYNAVSHIAAPSVLVDAVYGQLLLLKLCLVGLLMLLSASHVWGLRPRIRHAQVRSLRGSDDGDVMRAIADVHGGLAALAARLRLETGVGAAVLLATALMGQTLPPKVTVTTAADVISASISGEATMRDLRGQLTVAPPAVGTTTLTLRLWEKGTPVTADSGAAIIHLSPAGQPNLRANLTPRAQGARFIARGSLAATGVWHADVLVRTAVVNEYRTLPFTFTVGPGAAFLAPGLNPAAIVIAVSPGLITTRNTITVTGVKAPAVRLLSQSLDMQMGIQTYPATSLGTGRWSVTGVAPLMLGRWGFTVQARQGSAWVSLRQFVYQVPYDGPMHLLTPASSTSAATVSGGGPLHWTAVDGPHAIIHALARAPWSTLYAATSLGIFASSDSGVTWRPLGRGIPGSGAEPWGLAAVRGLHGDAILVASGNGAVYRLERGTTRWIQAGGRIGTQGAFSLLALPRSDVVLAGSDRGIFRSTDGGRTWAFAAPTDGGAILTFARDSVSGALYAGLAGVPRPLRVSLDGGRSWRIPSMSPLPPPSVEALLAARGHIYASVMGGPGGRAVWAGGAGGFTAFAAGLPRDAQSMNVAATSGTGGHLLMGTMGEGIYIRTSHGVWTRLGQGPGDGDVTSLLVLPGPHPVVLAGIDSGIYRLQLP